MLRHTRTCEGKYPRRRRGWKGLLAIGGLLPAAAFSASAGADPPKEPAPPARIIVFSRNLKARDRPAAGDRWRVRVSHYPMQEPEPHWHPPETWLFVATEVQRTEDGPRLLVTATREGESRPSVFLQLDPETGAITQVDSLLPVAGGVRTFTERVSPGEPFVSHLSPAPLSFALPDPPRGARDETDLAASVPASSKEEVLEADQGGTAGSDTRAPDGDGDRVSGAGDDMTAAGGAGRQTKASGARFGFGQQFLQQTEPIDAGVGRAMIQRGLRPLHLPGNAEMEAFGVPRFRTVIEGPGARVEQIWDETTPWPLYSQTDTSRSWLVVYTKGKS